MSTQPKLIYFAERHPALVGADFRRRWRQHARLGMSMPRWRNIARYVHCDPVPRAPTGLPRFDCDGVAIVCYRNEAARLAHVADRTAGPILKEDERETFARPVREFAALTDEFIFLPEQSPPTPAPGKVFIRVLRNAAIGTNDFADWWRNDAAPSFAARLEASSACLGYSHNLVRPFAGEVPLLCDCVEELGYTDPDAVARVLAETLKPAVAQGRISEWRCVWTAPTVLFDRERGIGLQ